MIQFAATYFDGKHPIGVPVNLHISDNGNTIVIGDNISYKCAWTDIKVSDQLGQTSRSLNLPNGAKCEAVAHQQINALQQQFSRSKFSHLLNHLESRWHYVALASLIVAVFSWAMIVYGIPSLAKQVAFALPTSVDEKISEGTIAFFDKGILDPSELPLDTQQRIQKKFDEIVARTDDEHNYRLLFRTGVGPNAFALPSGHIVVTDELVEIAEHDEEVLAVLTHEVGHVLYKHGLRNALQSSAVVLLLTAVTGDINAASGFAAALPVLLLQTSYSRKFEHEADQYAFDYMIEHAIDTKHFATILQKITGESSDDEDSVFTYLSTHPMTAERVNRFIEHSHSRDHSHSK